MIHQLLSITRPLFVIDCETTGIDPKTDKIVELSFQRWTAGGMDKEWRSLVNPGVPIPASATRVHSITDARIQGCAKCGSSHDGINEEEKAGDACNGFKPIPRFRDLAPNLAKGFADCDFAGKNVRFDLRILAAEFARVGQAWSYLGARIVDADRLEQLAVPRDLGSLHEKYTGKKHDGAHGALSDMRATMSVITGQLSTYPNLPRDLDTLHAAQWPNMIDLDGRFRFIEGVPCVSFGKWNGKPMKSVDTSYWDWICSTDFSAEVKALASDARLGKFPESSLTRQRGAV